LQLIPESAYNSRTRNRADSPRLLGGTASRCRTPVPGQELQPLLQRARGPRAAPPWPASPHQEAVVRVSSSLPPSLCLFKRSKSPQNRNTKQTTTVGQRVSTQHPADHKATTKHAKTRLRTLKTLLNVSPFFFFFFASTTKKPLIFVLGNTSIKCRYVLLGRKTVTANRPALTACLRYL